MPIQQTGYYDAAGVWHERGQAADPASYYNNQGQPTQGSNNNGGAAPPNPFDINALIDSYAQQRQGYRYRGIMQEGQVTYQNGVPGIMVKYDTPNGTSTEWTPITGWNGGANVPMNAYSGGGNAGSGGSSNPYYNQLQSLLNAQGTAQAADLRNAIQQALIGFGLVPENFSDKFGALDDLTRSLIAQNTESGISTYARLLENKNEGIKSLMNRLNARGLRRSGARGYGLRKNQLNADRSLADSLQGLMQYINSGYANYTQSEYQRQMQLLMAAMQYASGGGFSFSAPGGSSSQTTSTASTPAYSQVAPTGTFGSSQTDPAYNMGGGWWAM